MIILKYTLFMLTFLHGCHSFSYSILPNSQQSNSLNVNAQAGSLLPPDQGVRPIPNDTEGENPIPAQGSKPTTANQQPLFPNQRPHKTGSNPTTGYSQQNPSVLYINAPYGGQVLSYPPTQYSSQPPSDPPKSGFWDFFSFMSWPKTWLFGSSENPPTPGNQYAGFHSPNRQYQQTYYQTYNNQSPTAPPSGASVPSAPQAPLRHPQGLYQVPPPNSKYPFVPISPKYPSNYLTQSPQYDGSLSQPNIYNQKPNFPIPYYSTFKPQQAYPSPIPTYTTTANPTYSTQKVVDPVSPSGADSATTKNAYGSPQPAYSIYLVPTKPIYSAPSSPYGYVGPQAPQYPGPYRPPQYGMPSNPAQPYYQNPMPAYGDFGYQMRNHYFNIPQPSDAVYPKYPSTVKPDCCETPKPTVVDAETVNAAVAVVPPEAIAKNVTSSTLPPASTTTTETANTTVPIAVTDATVESTTATNVPDLQMQARHLFSGKYSSRGLVLNA